MQQIEKFYTNLFQNNKDKDLADTQLDKLLAKVAVNKVKHCDMGSFLEVGKLGKVLKQAISAREQALCQLTMCLSFRVEVTEEKDTKVVPWKWYSEGK